MKFKKLIFVTTLFLYVSTLSYSQNTLEGSEGNTSINYTQYGGGIITLNPANKKIELGYINYKTDIRPKIKINSSLRENYSISPYWYGISVSGKANNDISTVFSSGQITPSSEVNLKFGKRIYQKVDTSKKAIIKNIEEIQTALSGDKTEAEKEELRRQRDIEEDKFLAASEIWFIMRGGYNVSKVNLYDNSQPFQNQFISKRFDGLMGNIGINFWHPNLFKRNFIILTGLTIGLRKLNNIDDLDEITAKDVVETNDALTNTTRTFTEDRVGFAGMYQSYTSIPINFDVYIKPHNLKNAAFSFYGRFNSYYGRSTDENKNGRQHPINFGAGFYLLKENWLANPVGGFTIELKDSFNTLSSNKFKDKIVFNLITRVNILKQNE